MAAHDNGNRTIVLKFGSSVLGSAADLPRVVQEIYRHVRCGRRVLAVVSAYAGVTDLLFAKARAAGCDRTETAARVAVGEQVAAHALCDALVFAGIPAEVCDPLDIALRADGPVLDAELCAVDVAELDRRLSRSAAVVLPGFYGIGAEGRLALLGRGGSDMSALWVAHALGAECILVKDVDGLYERDPALPGPFPRRLVEASWATALAVAARLVQPKAIRFARSKRFAFGVGGALARGPTRVGPGPDRYDTARRPAAPLKVALLGLGTVGTGVWERLSALSERFEVTSVLVRHRERRRDAAVPDGLLVTRAAAALETDPDIVIELLGGLAPAAEIVDCALARGITVVTANKSLLAQHWHGLARYARGPVPTLRFSAAAGGAVPMLERLATIAQHHRVRGIRGVINGTSNYVLERMGAGIDYGVAVREAQERGFAEADPTADLNGLDAAFKLSLLARAGLGRDVDPLAIERRGIDTHDSRWVHEQRRIGRRVRLVAQLNVDGGAHRARIGPQALDPSDYLAGASGEENRLEILVDDGRRLRLAGKGAGRWPTTISVLADLLDAELQARDWHTRRLAVGEQAEARAPVNAQPAAEHGQRLLSLR